MHKIAVLPGDGTGPEVTAEAVKILQVAADKLVLKRSWSSLILVVNAINEPEKLYRTAQLKSFANLMPYC